MTRCHEKRNSLAIYQKKLINNLPAELQIKVKKLFSCRKGAYHYCKVSFNCVAFGVKFAQKPTYFPPPCDRKKSKTA